MSSRPETAASVERASATDRAFLAMDAGTVPEQFGVVLRLGAGSGLDLARTRALLADRVGAVPRLRQRLARTPFGCGGPVWVDDEAFDIGRHVGEVVYRLPADEQALLDTALSVVLEPLPRTASLWSAVLVTGLADGGSALVLVLHHVLADGVGGLEVLANLVDPGGRLVDVPFPRPRPTRSVLARDMVRTRLAGLRRVRRTWVLLRRSMSAGGGLHPPKAAPCSLNGRAGTRRAVAVVRVALDPLRAAAHRHGATTNDAVLVALTGALEQVLRTRGEAVESLLVTVPVSGRGAGDRSDLGNMVSPLLVEVPVTGDLAARLEQVAARVRADKASAAGPPPIALLGWLFRPLARLGVFRWYMNHQHRFHVLATHVRGPEDQVSFAGSPVVTATPLVVGEGGNTTIAFEILSYAGRLTVTAIADADHWPDLATFTDSLRSELELVSQSATMA
ncbi:MAG: wax ester/triacylglycerol synthase domain-containing protein [Nocardioides sp.]